MLDAAWTREYETFIAAVDAGLIPFAEQLPLARRFAWELQNERRIPEGFWLRHNCGVRECVNPAHAELVANGTAERS